MNKRTTLIIVAAVIILGGIGLALAGHKNANTGQMANTGSSQVAGSQTSNSNSVAIQSFAFTPANISVKKGTAVTWTNNDDVAHTVQETDGKTGPKSGDLGHGDKYSFTFNQTGTFKYHCSIHPDMLGTVTVTAG